MMTSRMDTPLFTSAQEQAACRVAMIRSLTVSGTGLSLRRHNRLIKLLEKVASESFSDGEVTQARVKTLATSLCCDRSTIFRILADARSIGLMVSDPRHGAIGQQISSERKILWSKLEELVAKSRDVSKLSATPPSQLRRPRRNCDAPVATATPCITDNPDRSDSHTKSGGSDQRFSDQVRTAVPESSIRDDADRLFRRLAYTGKEGQSLWLAAAAVRLGLLDEASVATAAALAGEAGKGPGWFRVVLADKANMDCESLKVLLGSIRVTPRLPGCRPVMNRGRPPDRQPVFRRPPAANIRDIDAEINDRRNAINDLVRGSSTN